MQLFDMIAYYTSVKVYIQVKCHQKCLECLKIFTLSLDVSGHKASLMQGNITHKDLSKIKTSLYQQ